MQIDTDAMSAFVRDYLLNHAPPAQNVKNGWRKTGASRWEHTERVLVMAQEIARAENADYDVVTVATIFHDVAKLSAAQEEHAVRGAEITRDYLARAGFSAGWIERVCQVIIHHPAMHVTPPSEMTLEVAVLRDADLLDELGAMSIVWTAMNTGIEAPSYAQARDRISKYDIESVEWALAHMLTPMGRKTAEQRRAFIENFLAQLGREMGASH